MHVSGHYSVSDRYRHRYARAPRSGIAFRRRAEAVWIPSSPTRPGPGIASTLTPSRSAPGFIDRTGTAHRELGRHDIRCRCGDGQRPECGRLCRLCRVARRSPESARSRAACSSGCWPMCTNIPKTRPPIARFELQIELSRARITAIFRVPMAPRSASRTVRSSIQITGYARSGRAIRVWRTERRPV